MSQPPNGQQETASSDNRPVTARQLRGQEARTLAELAAIFDDLQFVLGCCERLLGALSNGQRQDTVLVESLWVAALSTYARCFRPRKGGAALRTKDLSKTPLKGEVVKWHEMLG